jgi:Uma2 family endonuclease
VSRYGELIWNPEPTEKHEAVCQRIQAELTDALGSAALQRIAITTDRGIRTPGIVWMSAARWEQVKGSRPLPFVPDVCVEVVSARDTREATTMKTAAYLRGGAREVIVVRLNGETEFFGPEGKRAASALGIVLDLPAALF